MGALASAARAHNGKTIGVIPKALVHRELADVDGRRADRHRHHARAEAGHGGPRGRLIVLPADRHARGVLRGLDGRWYLGMHDKRW